MSSLAKLFARRQWLLDRLQQSTGSHERDAIKRLLAEIDEALALLDNSSAHKVRAPQTARPGQSRKWRSPRRDIWPS
jgi:hypothetical protein